MKKLTLIFFALIFILLLIPTTVYTINTDIQCRLTVVMDYGDKPISGMDVSVCHVADAKETSGGIEYVIVPSFSATGVDFTDLTKEKNIALAASLNAFAAANDIFREIKSTDNSGKAVFNDLPAGLYLVAQADAINIEYIIAPYLVAVPIINEKLRVWDYNVTAYPKTEPRKRDFDTVSVSVHKIWVGTNEYPANIHVQLYRNSDPHGSTVLLSAKNYWSHTWDNLDPDNIWTVDEINAPAGYTKTVSGKANTGFIITNTKKPVITDVTTPQKTPKKNSDIPKTGITDSTNLWIMLIVLNCAGLFVLVFVSIIKRKKRKN